MRINEGDDFRGVVFNGCKGLIALGMTIQYGQDDTIFFRK